VRWLDNFLNALTMYRLVLYGLALLAVVGIGLSYSDRLSLSGSGLIVSLATLLIMCFITNTLFAYFYKAATNVESSLITALILFFILPPPTDLKEAVVVGVAGLLAMASKYILAFRQNHIFNPAACAAVIVGLLGLVHAVWWVGSSSMLPFTLIFGFLILYKLRRFSLFFCFMIPSLLIILFLGLHHGLAAGYLIKSAFISYPLVFLGTIMLTEPATLPTRQKWQLIYASLVGVLFASELKLGPIYSSPEIALVIGNLFSWFFRFRQTLKLRLVKKEELSSQIFGYNFEPIEMPKFTPGQYLEWTLPHPHSDGRGNRRTFTISSSPTETTINLGVKFYEPSSSFKKSLRLMRPGAILQVAHLGGDFVLSGDVTKKLVFIAGGIGITPFRSMLKYMIDTSQKRNIVLFYLVNTEEEVVYKDILAQAGKQGVKVIKVLGNATTAKPGTYIGRLTTDTIKHEVSAYKTREYYISGSNNMVKNSKAQLKSIGIAANNIHTDYFSGY
jgi:ferredoxin-NADP reductase